MDRLFTVEEADAELPALREHLPRLRDARQGLIAATERIETAVARDGGGVAEPAWFAQQQTLKDEVEYLVGRGILLRDADAGLVDFPAEREGRRIFLCWRLGEDEVAWFHEERSGFTSRKSL